MSKIDEILDKYYNGRTLDIIKTEVWFTKAGEPPKPASWYTEAKAELLQLVLEVIGSNQNEYLTPPMRIGESGENLIDGTPNQLAIQNNRLRAEQRQKAYELFGKKQYNGS